MASFDITNGNLLLNVFPGVDALAIEDLVGREVKLKIYEMESAA